MAPKLLTDCPENLREAIDWLVQVRHCGGVSTVSDALATLFDNVAQDAEKSLPSLPDPDRPSARDVVSKLRAFQSTLPKDSENPNKNIIHNLCTSAGSLLGYRYPGTYDGSGIVYGNASRLCDAILAFLYAVFSDVHDNQPYVAGRSVLYDDVIVPLKPQPWRGHNGFCQAIPKVATGLQRYNAAVKASNERVKKPIETVLDYVKPGGGLRTGINGLQISETSTSTQDEQTVESAVLLVERCKEVAKVFSKSLTAAKEAIDDLNPKLKRKLDNGRRSFFNHVDWLSKWSKKGEKKRLDKMVQKIKSRLRQLAKAVKDRIKQEVHTVVELLKKRVSDIKMKLEAIAASLEKYVKELGTWMDDAKKYIKDVRKYVNRIMEQLHGANRQAIDKAAADIDSVLGKKVEELNQWIETAEAAVKAAKEKADEVYGRLDKDSGPKISEGLQKIDDARNKVDSVNSELKTVHSDLVNWRTAVQDVLSKAAGKADEVSRQLDPAKDKSTLGGQINAIDTANNDIMSANEQLGEQVKSLNEWIESAEKIRKKAEQKAKEAYSKLNVHGELSKNVDKIVKAKEKIESVNKSVNSHLESLKQWNAEAKEVLDGAVQKAQAVHDALDIGGKGEQLKKQFEGIEQANQSIQAANKTLQEYVDHLGNWSDAAGKVIDQAKAKCDKILEKVKTTKDGMIFAEATKLKEQGIKLVEAAKDAKQKVEQRVKDALDAVKAMDTDLKRDLKAVKDKIKEGIKKVIKDLGVGKLDEEVKEDLKELRDNILKLKQDVEKSGDQSLVKGQLEELGDAKTSLTEKTGHIKTQTEEMEENFRSKIKDPLNSEVEKVTTAIKALYGKINPNDGRATDTDKKQLHKIFEHIRNEVEKIKGKAGSSAYDKNANGLDGIASKVRWLALSFVNKNGHGFSQRVDGWLEHILGLNNKSGMKAVISWIDVPQQTFSGQAVALKDEIKLKIKNALKNQMHAAQQKITATDVKESIVENLKQIKAACDKFVEELDNQLTNNQIEEFVNKIITEIPGSSGSGRQGENDNLKTGVSAALIALCRCVWQVASEINFLGVGMFGGIIDETKKTVDNLHGNLKAATSTGGAATGTAQAVDEAIKGVSNEVKGLDGKFKDVKKPLEDAVRQLDTAVEAYDKQAREQVKAAARGAITAAANVINQNGDKSRIDLSEKMPRFDALNKQIQDGLATKLQGLLDTHIGENDPKSASGFPPGSPKKQPTKVILPATFKNYGNQITQPSDSAKDPTGSVPEAITKISTEGMADLVIIGDSGGMINTQTFEDPFKQIGSQLEEIIGLVNGTDTMVFFDNSDLSKKGVKVLLKELNDMIALHNANNLYGITNGLINIETAIDGLRKVTFGSKPKAIEQSVLAIKAQVEEISKKLKGDKDSKGDVINSLKYLKDTGLASGTLNGKDGRQVGGLQKIEEDLRKQNEELGKQPGIIDEAIDSIKYELFQVGIRLSHKNETDDVIDQLDWLRRKIGMGDAKTGNLNHVYDTISRLQSQPFTEKPDAIGQAKTAMEEEL